MMYKQNIMNKSNEFCEIRCVLQKCKCSFWIRRIEIRRRKTGEELHPHLHLVYTEQIPASLEVNIILQKKNCKLVRNKTAYSPGLNKAKTIIIFWAIDIYPNGPKIDSLSITVFGLYVDFAEWLYIEFHSFNL